MPYMLRAEFDTRMLKKMMEIAEMMQLTDVRIRVVEKGEVTVVTIAVEGNGGYIEKGYSTRVRKCEDGSIIVGAAVDDKADPGTVLFVGVFPFEEFNAAVKTQCTTLLNVDLDTNLTFPATGVVVEASS